MTPTAFTVPNVAEAAATVRWFRRRVELARDPGLRAMYREALENALVALEEAEASELEAHT